MAVNAIRSMKNFDYTSVIRHKTIWVSTEFDSVLTSKPSSLDESNKVLELINGVGIVNHNFCAGNVLRWKNLLSTAFLCVVCKHLVSTSKHIFILYYLTNRV